MGFITSLLIIAVCGFFSYLLYHKFGLSKGHNAWIAWYAIIIVGGLMILDVLIYFGFLDFIFSYLNILPWVNIDNGQDFMWNSFILLGIDWGINYKDPSLIPIAIFLWVSYPMWFKWFSNGSRMLFGSKAYQRGIWYLLEPTRKPKKEGIYAKQPERT
ncbi:MAG: hypothetical protein ACTSQP_13910 [Promethearchaeota archaeon]